MPSTHEHPEVIDKYIQKELNLGRIAGPFEKGDLQPPVHINRFGIIPKKHQEGKYRLIVDMSYPDGGSINDGIDPDLCSLTYLKLEEVVHAIGRKGKGALLAKMDLESAYRIIPVHPSDRHLIGMEWKGKVYFDLALPFGLRSAPKIFNSVADALEWILHRFGIQELFHYLDDYITIGSADSNECAINKEIMTVTCGLLGTPLAQEKCEGPSTIITFLGIEIDTTNMQLQLPREKLDRLSQLVTEWSIKKSCTKRELDSLIGQLQHVCAVVKPGRSFLRRMIELSKIAHKPWHYIRLNHSFHSDLMWWRLFLHLWNGISMMSTLMPTYPDLSIISDASGTWGCAAVWDTHWFQLEWGTGPFANSQIASKELLPIIIACVIWGKGWKGHHVLCYCDNESVVSVLNSRTSKDQSIMHMLRSLFFFEASLGFILSAKHIPGSQNDIADDLSRNRLSSFFTKVPHADALPTAIPPELPSLLMNQQLDWASRSWMSLFGTILEQV